MFTNYRGGHGKGFMRNTGNLASARESWLKMENKNLDFLLHARYSWMNEFIGPGKSALEVGSGIGASKGYLRSDIKTLISDNNSNSWLDLVELDAGNISNYKYLETDCLIANNVIHHLAFPGTFIVDAFGILPEDGKLIVQEINTSLLCRIILKVLRHEAFNEEANPFIFDSPMSDASDNWDANCSIPKILFSDSKKFSDAFPGLTISYFRYTETLLLLMSGGVTAKTWYPKVPIVLLKLITKIDQILCKVAPNLFALQMQIVIERLD